MPQLTLKTESVDYGGGRGQLTINTVINVAVNGRTLSFSSGGTSGATNWGICGVDSNYRICVDAQYNTGSGWTTISHNEMGVAICPSLTNTAAVVDGLVNAMPSATVSRSGRVRLIYYANSEPAPTPSLPNSFPSSTYAEASQVPIDIEVVSDYRPGQRKQGDQWLSHNRGEGRANIRAGGTWREMRTEENKPGLQDPPAIRRNGEWISQAKIGAGA